mmetsp:Transcript_6431/g.19123  ORF Transcript_6431/g.19123 Transcript_6431/m.19123 type:complete len:217 (-) Transcript_6431:627-1277(-)
MENPPPPPGKNGPRHRRSFVSSFSSSLAVSLTLFMTFSKAMYSLSFISEVKIVTMMERKFCICIWVVTSSETLFNAQSVLCKLACRLFSNTYVSRTRNVNVFVKASAHSTTLKPVRSWLSLMCLSIRLVDRTKDRCWKVAIPHASDRPSNTSTCQILQQPHATSAPASPTAWFIWRQHAPRPQVSSTGRMICGRVRNQATQTNMPSRGTGMKLMRL